MRLKIHGYLREMDEMLRASIDTHARLTLGRVSPRLESVTLYLQDVNGPRGGEDKQCRLVAKLLPSGELTVHGLGEDWEKVIHSTLRRLSRAIIRELDRRRATRGRRAAS